jgi:hypothetical protein
MATAYSYVQFSSPDQDKEVRLKLKQQLRGLVERIDVGLVKKQVAVFYIGRDRGRLFITPDVSPPMFKLAQRN